MITVGWTIYRDRFWDHLDSFCRKASGADGPKPTSRERGWGRANTKTKPAFHSGGLGVLFPFFAKRGGLLNCIDLCCVLICVLGAE